jgi:hypothetical protein
MHKPTTGMAGPTPEEKRTQEDAHLNRKGKRAKRSKERKAGKCTKRQDPAPLLARIDALTRLCQAQGAELAVARRSTRGAIARSSVYWEEIASLLSRADAPGELRSMVERIKQAADEADRHASQPRADDSRVSIDGRGWIDKPAALGPSHVESPKPVRDLPTPPPGTEFITIAVPHDVAKKLRAGAAKGVSVGWQVGPLEEDAKP